MATVSLACTVHTRGPKRPGVAPLGIAVVVQKRATQTRGFELERVSRQLRDLNVYVVTITLNPQASPAKWSSAVDGALERAKQAVGDASAPVIVGGLGDAASLAAELGVAHNAAGIVSFNSYALSIAWSLRRRDKTTLLLSTLSAPIWLRSDNALASRIIGETSRHRSIDGTSGQLERELRKFLTASASQWPEELRSRASALAAKTAFAMAMVGGGSTLLAVAKAGAVQRHGDGIIAPVAQMSDQPSARKLVGGFAISHRQRLGDSRLRASNVIGTPSFQHGAGYETTRTATTSTVGTTISHITTPKQTSVTISHPSVPGPGTYTHSIATPGTWTTTISATGHTTYTFSGGTTYVAGPGIAVYDSHKTPSHFHATSHPTTHRNVHTVVQATSTSVVNHRTHVHYPNRPKLVTSVGATPGDSQAIVSWTNPSSNGDPADHYIVEYSSDGGTSWSSPLSTQSGSDSSLTVTGLLNGTSYLFRVAAVDANAFSSSWGETQSPIHWSGASGSTQRAPSAPIHLSVEVKGRKITVRWNAPNSAGSSPITHYTVSFSPGGRRYRVTGRTWINRVRGFNRNKRYTITVYASNAAGDSPIAVLHNVRG